MKKVLVSSLAVVAMLGFLTVATSAVKATVGDGNYPPIIQKLVERFGLKAEEVQEVFDEARQEMRQDMQLPFEQKFEEMLDKAVEQSKLTQEQKEAIQEKRDEMQKKYEELAGLGCEERHTKMQEIQQELKAWAEENGIDLRFVGGFGRGGFMMGPHKGFDRGFKTAW